MFFLLLLIDIILILNIYFLKSPIIGGFFLFLYLIANGYLAGQIIGRVFSVKDQILRIGLGIFLIFSLISFLGSIFIVFYKFNNLILSGIIILTGLLNWLAYKKIATTDILGTAAVRYPNIPISRYFNFKTIKLYSFKIIKTIKQKYDQFKPSSFLTPLFITVALLFIIGFYTLFASAALNKYITAPWEAIPAQFVWVIAVLAALLLGFIFFRPGRFLLWLIILFSLLLHLYLPAVYRLPYTGDSWRHIGSVKQIIDNGRLSSKPDDYVALGPVSIANTLITAPSYGAFWASTIFLNKVLQIDLVFLMVWWPYLFFSIFAPLLIFVLLNKIFLFSSTISEHLKITSDQFALLGVFLLSLFFPLQLYGSAPLPVGFGFLFFLFFLITAVFYCQNRQRFVLYFLLVEFGLMFFSYVVYWLSAGLVLGFIAVDYLTKQYQFSIKKKLLRIGYLLISLSLIPAVGLLVSPNARFEILKTGPDFFLDFWQHVFLSFFGLKGISNLHLSSGNFFWNSSRGYLVNIWPFNFEYFDTLLIAGILSIMFFGLFFIVRKISSRQAENKILSLILYLLYICLGTFWLDRYYFGGIHLLTERLVLAINLSLLLIILYGIVYIITFWPNQKIIKIILISLFAFTIASVYVSGPVHGRVTKNQYLAMQKLYQDMNNAKRGNYCVLAEHFPLTALEAVSGGKIKQGQFPIKYGYLSESGSVFIKMFSQPDVRWLQQSQNITGAPGCYFVLDKQFTAAWSLGAINKILGKPIFRIDDVYVWVYDGE